MNILFIVPYAPTLIRTRPYNLVASLARRGHTVTLATLAASAYEREALAALAGQGVRVWAQPLPRTRVVGNLLAGLLGRAPLQARHSWQPALAAQLGAALANGQPPFDVIHVEHLRGAEYGRFLLGGRRPPVVWDSVDCISLLFEHAQRASRSGFGRLVTRLELPRTRAYEAELVNAFDAVLATAPRDRAALEALGRGGAAGGGAAPKVQVLPNGVDLRYFCLPDPPAAEAAPPVVVMTGKMSYHANVTAALHLVNDIMPLVWRERPEVRVVLAGSSPPRALQRLAERFPGTVTVTGFVNDLRPHLWGATVAAAPIPYGAGIQNKVLEAMACGVPVVASPQASSALEAGSDALLVAGEAAEFAGALLAVLGSPARRAALRAAARRYVEAHHDWEAIAARLEGYYREAILAAPGQAGPASSG